MIRWIGAGAEPLGADQAGGKGRALDELHRLGARVPPAFVLTADAYRDAVSGDGGLAEEIGSLVAAIGEDTEALEEISARVRRLVFDGTAGHAADAELRAAYRELGADAAVAVRSSSVAEDSAERSFAGEHDTYLWVSGEDAVSEAVRRCWASLFTARAISYRGVAHGDDAMAVVVQQMVDATASGVFMTLNPANGDRSKIVVESVWGLGEPLVSGQVNPDRFMIDKVTREILDRAVADKPSRAVRDPTTGIGTAVVAVPDADRNRPSLTDEQLDELVDLARRVERHAGRPQDGEFALDHGRLYLLQSRPETAWSARPAQSVTGGGSSDALTHVIAALSGDRTRGLR
ncbi:PEP/pyruvate-binding domain-containing protein [Pseudonocardia acaciae]|uniref:PEP/pyruvate-binding domain-containing protein n=1 Tax=Pseudonocardia acaciae TaxID=551276 RepID=UPI000563537B|nr:PEP/pyruvate-binding domain-containing protein [Pseudonocardia acaciae]